MSQKPRPEPQTSPESSAPEQSLESILAQQEHGGFRRYRWLGLLLAAGLALFAGRVLLTRNGGSGKATYKTETATRGELIVTVTATGNLEPTNRVDVGSEQSGTMKEVFVEEDDQVSEGQVLAELDLSSFEDAVAESRAALQAAEASLSLAQATEIEARAKLNRYREVSRLSDSKIPSKVEMDTAEAEMARAEAEIASAEAAIAQAKATLHVNETKLEKARIKSPIDGIVLERDVDPGQAVAASLQAVTLFTLAEDLSKMELEVDVDEADVGQVKAGLKASFMVDAWPDRRFEAMITRVGFNATDDGGVITYPAVLKVENEDLSLRPGMTATAEITTLTRDSVLLIPNAALRFTPASAIETTASDRGILESLMPGPPRSAQKATSNQNGSGKPRVWILKNGVPEELEVKIGISDGSHTEIVEGDLQEGMEVIVEEVDSTS